MTLHKWLSAVTIPSGANGIRATADGSTATCTVTAGTYYISSDGAATDLLDAIVDALNAGTSKTWTATIASGLVGLRSTSGAWSIDWAHAGSTFDETILGCTSSTMSGASSVYDYAEVQHKYAWYSTQFVVADSRRTGVADVSQHVGNDGTTCTVLHGSSHSERTVKILGEPAYKAFPTSGYTNQDWSAFWATINAGQGLRYYPDVSTTTVYAAYTNANGSTTLGRCMLMTVAYSVLRALLLALRFTAGKCE